MRIMLETSYFTKILIMVSILLLILCIFLIKKIKKLKEHIDFLNNRKEFDKNLTYNDANIIPIKRISEGRIINNINNNNLKAKQEIEIKKEEIEKQKEEIKKEEPIIKNEITPNTIQIDNNIPVEENFFNANEFIQNKKSDNYLEEVSEKIQKEINSKPIPPTNYEQEEESNAIISYQELLNSKGKDSIDDTTEFIEQLKNFRNSLN